MSSHSLETDYLIVGSGAMGMAFADIILQETDANIVMVDMHHKPGGHWNNAYPFVTLHQPSSYYGVSSRELSQGTKDEVGLNKGLNELATGSQVSAYFDDVMRQQFLPTGRIKYFPMCEYKGNGEFVSKMNGDTYSVTVNKKTVDSTYLKTTVPSTHKPNFSVAEGVAFCPLNDLPKAKKPYDNYMVIGGGKTGIDACLWLLEKGVDPDKIQWVMPRDAWLIDRKNTQPTEEFFTSAMGAQASQVEALAQAESVEDLFDRLEKSGALVRIYKDVQPKMYHGATVSQDELVELRRITNVVRMGHVSSIEQGKVVLAQGTVTTPENTLYVDCSACAVGTTDIVPVFQEDVITLQTVRTIQPVFSAAFIAHIEAVHNDDKTKNTLCQVVPIPNHAIDWLKVTAAFMRNQHIWSQDPDIQAWLCKNRLDGFTNMVRSVSPEDSEKMAVLQRLRGNAMPAMAKLQQFLGQLQQQAAKQ